jgi:hypothetical protein
MAVPGASSVTKEVPLELHAQSDGIGGFVDVVEHYCPTAA